jgi:phage protein U
MAVMHLMSFGPIQFEVYPLNFHEADHHTASDYARKDILESSPLREWVGEGDEEVILRGRCFPFAVTKGADGKPRGIGVGAKSALDQLDMVRRQHQAHQLVRTTGTQGEILGWFVLEKLQRHHSHVGAAGIGRVINFDAVFMRADIASAASYFTAVQRITVGV